MNIKLLTSALTFITIVVCSETSVAQSKATPQDVTSNQPDMLDGTASKKDGVTAAYLLTSRNNGKVQASIVHDSLSLTLSAPVNPEDDKKQVLAADFDDLADGTTATLSWTFREINGPPDLDKLLFAPFRGHPALTNDMVSLKMLRELKRNNKLDENQIQAYGDLEKVANKFAIWYGGVEAQVSTQDFAYFAEGGDVKEDTEYSYAAAVNCGYKFSGTAGFGFSNATVHFSAKHSDAYKAQDEESRGVISSDETFFTTVSAQAGAPKRTKRDTLSLEFRQLYGDESKKIFGINPKVTYDIDSEDYGFKTGLFLLPDPKQDRDLLVGIIHDWIPDKDFNQVALVFGGTFSR